MPTSTTDQEKPVRTMSGDVVTFECRGETVRFFVTNPEDEVQKYLFKGEFYEELELQIIEKYYRPGTTFVDIGANIGNHSVYAERILKAPRVVVFEPNPVAIEHMKINLALNGCRNVDLGYLGHPIGDAVGKPMSVVLSPSNNLGNTVYGYSPDGEFTTITGDSALAARPVGFVKIDTEEMEFEALAGLVETLRRWRPTIFVEAVEAREAELRSWAEAQGYSIAESQKRYLYLRNYILVPDPRAGGWLAAAAHRVVAGLRRVLGIGGGSRDTEAAHRFAVGDRLASAAVRSEGRG